MEYKPLPIGVDNFEKLITRGYYFVDKSLLIKDLLDKRSDVNLFTRPRRFGKTLNMSMLQYFFEDAHDGKGDKIDNSALFDGMDIMQAGENYLAHMGKYPVINLTFKDTNQPDFSLAEYEIKHIISEEYARHAYVIEYLEQDTQKERFQQIIDMKASRAQYNTSLKFLCECLEKYYGRKAIILLDEYDVPLESAFARGYYGVMVDFIRTLFSSALKTNGSLEFAVITGCLRVSKESIFTGLNNLNVISILNNAYGEYFGFTDDEVRKICTDYHRDSNYEEIKKWYNGYLFGNANIYNPWSVIKYMFDHLENPDNFPDSYWANTSSNTIVRKLIEMANDEVKQEIEHLIGGGTVEKPIHEDITYDEIYDSMDNLWNFMFFTGYFRKVSERQEADTKFFTLCIPNTEVKTIFKRKIMAWFQEQMKERNLSVLHTAVVNKDVQTLEDELNDILLHTISYMDANESYYHGILTGLLTGMPGYYLKSNRESGTGRCDLMAIPVSRRKEAFIFEFKKADDIDDLEAKAKEALDQIDARNYRQDLLDMSYKISSSYGIAFCGKDCLVMHRG